MASLKVPCFCCFTKVVIDFYGLTRGLWIFFVLLRTLTEGFWGIVVVLSRLIQHIRGYMMYYYHHTETYYGEIMHMNIYNMLQSISCL